MSGTAQPLRLLASALALAVLTAWNFVSEDVQFIAGGILVCTGLIVFLAWLILEMFDA